MELMNTLNTLGDDRQLHRVCQSQDRTYDLAVLPSVFHRSDECPVDLHGVDRKPLEIAQTRVSRTKIIEAYLYAEVFYLPEHADGVLRVLHYNSFSDLQLQAARVEPGFKKDIFYLVDESRLS